LVVFSAIDILVDGEEATGLGLYLFEEARNVVVTCQAIADLDEGQRGGMR